MVGVLYRTSGPSLLDRPIGNEPGDEKQVQQSQNQQDRHRIVTPLLTRCVLRPACQASLFQCLNTRIARTHARGPPTYAWLQMVAYRKILGDLHAFAGYRHLCDIYRPAGVAFTMLFNVLQH